MRRWFGSWMDGMSLNGMYRIALFKHTSNTDKTSSYDLVFSYTCRLISKSSFLMW